MVAVRRSWTLHWVRQKVKGGATRSDGASTGEGVKEELGGHHGGRAEYAAGSGHLPFGDRVLMLCF